MHHEDKVGRSPDPFIHEALRIGAIELIPGGRALRSGRQSPYFFNSGLFNTGHSLKILAHAYASQIHQSFRPEVIFGPAYKGIPLVASVAVVLGNNTEYAFNRKEAKSHGEKGTIVGAPLAGKKVLILDDVITTGASSSEAVEVILREGGIPIGCVIAFDRQEKGSESELSAVQEFEKKHGIPVRAVATLSDLVNYLRTHPTKNRSELLSLIRAYQHTHCIYQ